MIWTTKRKGASWAAYWTAREIITAARHMAECTGFRAKIMPRAPKIITGASSQKATLAPVTSGINSGTNTPSPALRRMLALVPEALIDRPGLHLTDVAGPVIRLACRGQT